MYRKELLTIKLGTLAIAALSTTGQTIMAHPSTSFSQSQNNAINTLKVSESVLRVWNPASIADNRNTVVVHCNSGKGRTGTAICAILLYMGYCENMDETLRFFGHQRFVCGKGVSQPCQLRYLYYFEGFYKKQIKSPSVKRLRAI